MPKFDGHIQNIGKRLAKAGMHTRPVSSKIAQISNRIDTRLVRIPFKVKPPKTRPTKGGATQNGASGV